MWYCMMFTDKNRKWIIFLMLKTIDAWHFQEINLVNADLYLLPL